MRLSTKQPYIINASVDGIDVVCLEGDIDARAAQGIAHGGSSSIRHHCDNNPNTLASQAASLCQ
jgi:hypothetical protein